MGCIHTFVIDIHFKLEFISMWMFCQVLFYNTSISPPSQSLTLFPEYSSRAACWTSMLSTAQCHLSVCFTWTDTNERNPNFNKKAATWSVLHICINLMADLDISHKPFVYFTIYNIFKAYKSSAVWWFSMFPCFFHPPVLQVFFLIRQSFYSRYELVPDWRFSDWSWQH